MKKALSFSIIFFSIIYCSGQKPDTIDLRSKLKEHRIFPNNSIYLEFFGHSMGIGSLNYETVLTRSKDFYLTGRMGLGYHPGSHYETISFPLLVNGIYQLSNSFALECGIGTCISYTFWPDWTENVWAIFWTYKVFHEGGTYFDPLLTGNVGIRIQSRNGFLFRFGFTPVVNLTSISEELVDYSIIPRKIGYWFGFSFGYSFK